MLVKWVGNDRVDRWFLWILNLDVILGYFTKDEWVRGMKEMKYVRKNMVIIETLLINFVSLPQCRFACNPTKNPTTARAISTKRASIQEVISVRIWICKVARTKEHGC